MVSHILVDGEELSAVTNIIREYCRDFQATIRQPKHRTTHFTLGVTLFRYEKKLELCGMIE